MPRIRSVAAVPALNRRTLLAATGAVSLSAGIGLALRPESPAHAAVPEQATVADSVARSKDRAGGGRGGAGGGGG
ncbi:TIGR03767 family metallophosphoesterase, partial [Streptomyces sp. NPDC006446]